MNQPSEVELTSEEGKRLEVAYFGPGETSEVVTLKNPATIKHTNGLSRVYLNNSHSAQISQPNYAVLHIKNFVNYTLLSPVDGKGKILNEVKATEVLLTNSPSLANLKSCV